MPFGGLETGEAISAMSLMFLILGIFVYAETRAGGANPLLRVILVGFSVYFITLAETALLTICFVGFSLYNLMKLVKE